MTPNRLCLLLACFAAFSFAAIPFETRNLTAGHDSHNRPFDVVIIGSGISAMAAGTGFASRGKKVLMLEKLYQTGGCTHTFERDGATFDSGFHLFSDMKQLQIMTNLYGPDVNFVWPSGYPRDYINIEGRIYQTPNGLLPYIFWLYETFPEDGAALTQFFVWMDMLSYTSRHTLGEAAWNMLPATAQRIVQNDANNINAVMAQTSNYSSFSNYVNRAFVNNDLKIILAGGASQFIATPPSYMPPVAGLDVLSQFSAGFSFPMQGPTAIQSVLAERLAERGGVVQANAEVAAILLDSTNTTAIGVKLVSGTEYMAQYIVSSVGLDAIRPLMRGATIPTEKYPPNQQMHSMGFFITFLKMDMSARSLGLNPFSIFYPVAELSLMDYQSGDAILAGLAPLLMFERTLKTTAVHPTGHPETEPVAVLEIMSSVYWWEWSEWAGTTTHQHPDSYYEDKAQLQAAQLAEFYAFCPQCVGHVAFNDSGTPLSIRDFVTKTDGGALGYLGLSGSQKPTIYTGINGLTFVGCDIMTSLSCAAETGTMAVGVATGDAHILSQLGGIL